MKVAILAVLLAFAAGWLFGEVPRAVERFTEEQAIYGVPPDASKPWGPPACRSLAGDVELGRLVREAGGRKSLYMAALGRRLDPSNPYLGEAIGELSMAWDLKETGMEFYTRCLQAILDANDKPKLGL